MASWLEEEEQKLQLQKERDKEVHESLRKLYDLCERVNKIKKRIDYSWFYFSGPRYTTDSIWDRELGMHVDESAFDSIQIQCSDPEGIFIEVVTTASSGYQREKVHIRKKCTLQDLRNWSEDQILYVLKWLVSGLGVYWGVSDNIPGTTLFDRLLEEREWEEQKKKKEKALLQEKWRKTGCCEICGKELGILERLGVYEETRCKSHREN